jgi:thiamine biosynthesis lipoprotein
MNDTYDVAAVFAETGATLKQYHELFDKYNAYENIENIYTINQDSSLADDETNTTYGTKVISQELYDALDLVLSQESLITSGGVALFNIALSPVLSLWHDARYSVDCTTDELLYSSVCVPPSNELLALSYNTDPQDIELIPESRTIRFKKPGMGIDLGGFGKGYVSEVITDALDARGITYLLNAGNSNIKA